MTFFDKITSAPVDSILGLTAAFNADSRAQKVNLSVGMFKTADLKTPILESVKKAEAFLVQSEVSKEYLPIEGPQAYIEKVGSLIFGEPFWSRSSEKIAGIASIGGTGALRIGGDFLKQEVNDEIYLSDPTWPNHKGVMTRCGMKGGNYPYYDIKKQRLEFDHLYSFLEGLSSGCIILLHASCHNPTGADLSLAQWKILSDLFLEKHLIPFFDFAYQGFDVGLDEDAKAIRLFAEAGHEMLVASSFSKNLALYAERVGALFVVTGSASTAQRVLSKVKTIVRTNYSNPPLHGASVVCHILSTPSLKNEWEGELAAMRMRIIEMREALAQALAEKSFLKDRKGLFCFCGLEKKQVDRLISEYGIYMTSDGRINVAGLNRDNLNYVVESLRICGF